MFQEFNFETDPFRAFAEYGGEFEQLEFESAAGWQGEVNRGSRDYTRWSQLSLNLVLGLRLAEDGIKGTQTSNAIRNFQQQRGLPVDGIVGTRTEAALIAGGAPQPPGSSNMGCRFIRTDPAYIRWVQQSLNQVAAAGLAVNGVNDVRTRAAVRAFQQSGGGLTADGIVGTQTEAALVAAGAPRPPTVAGPGCTVSRVSSAYIRWVQQALNAADGAGLTLDGVNGTKTRAAVRTFQLPRDLTVDGVVGERTELLLIAETGLFPPGLNTPVCGGCAPFNSRIRLHLKVLHQPPVPIGVMLRSMRDLYATVNILVEPVSVEYLSLPALDVIDLDGDCPRGATPNVSADQRLLFAHRNHVCQNEFAAYFVLTLTNPEVNGCSSHLPNLPSMIVDESATDWSLAHEAGHVLGLSHVASRDRLMFGGGTQNITNLPPDLVASEVATINGSGLAINC